MAKYDKLESYGIEEDNFEGDKVCYKCPKRSKGGPCSVYPVEGMTLRNSLGHCPVVNRWANWRDDRPVVKATKKRIGQQKQR